MGSMGQLQFDSSSREFYHCASETVFSDSPLARIVIGFMSESFSVGFMFFFTGDIFSYCSRMSRSLFTLSQMYWYFTCALFFENRVGFQWKV